MIDIQRLMDYLRDTLQSKESIDRLETIVREGSSRAGRSREQVFTREFFSRLEGFLLRSYTPRT